MDVTAGVHDRDEMPRLSEGEFVIVPDAKAIEKPGKIFIEACIKDGLLNNPEIRLVKDFQQQVLQIFC